VANLTFGDVLLIGGVATVGFTLLSWWFSGLMANKNWSLQVKGRAKAPERPPDEKPSQ
jgi:hypothetical protein